MKKIVLKVMWSVLMGMGIFGNSSRGQQLNKSERSEFQKEKFETSEIASDIQNCSIPESNAKTACHSPSDVSNTEESGRKVAVAELDGITELNELLSGTNGFDAQDYDMKTTYSHPVEEQEFSTTVETPNANSIAEENHALGLILENFTFEYGELQRQPSKNWSAVFAQDSEKMLSDQSDTLESSPEKEGPGASLAFVFDSTGSMGEELQQVKVGAGQILEAVLSNKQILIDNFVFVPFNDPDIGPVSITKDPNDFLNMVASIYTYGGADCPEMSVGALKKAIEVSRPNSYFYVFTDADPKDASLQDSVLALIQRKKAQVVFILTGSCGKDPEVDYGSRGVYQRLAEASSGQVYHLKKREVEQVLKYVKLALKPNTVGLISVKLPAPPLNKPDKHAVVVDQALKEFTVSVSGKEAGITVSDPTGIIRSGPPQVEPLLNLTNVKVVNVKEPDPGRWHVAVESKSEYSLRATGLSDLQFKHGFSATPNASFDETNNRPLLGSNCFLLIQVPKGAPVYNITLVEIQGLNGSIILKLPMLPHSSLEGVFVSPSFSPPSQTQYFNLGISGFGSDGSPIRRITNPAISASLPERPVVKMQKLTIAYAMSPLSIFCNVTSLAPFTVKWFHGNRDLNSTTTHPQTTQVRLQIEQPTEKHGGIYKCRVENVAGVEWQSTNLIVKGTPPEVVMAKKEVVVEVGQDLELPCKVHSYYNSSFDWGQLFNRNEFSGVVHQVLNGQILPNASLIIKNVSEADEGWYVCSAWNKWGRREARVYVRVKNPLRVVITPASASFTKGESLKLVCRVVGASASSIQWRRDLITITNQNHSVYVEELPEELHLLLSFLEEKHAGVYSCIASNEEDEASANAELFYTEKPSIKAESSSVVVKEGSPAELVCNATGVPAPLVLWKKDGHVLHADENHKVDNGVLKIESVTSLEAGEVTCVARNNLGEAEDHIWLSVGIPPSFVQKPRDKRIQIEHNGTVVCSVHGSPRPNVTWSRDNGLDFARMILLKSGGLRVTHAQLSDEGTYTCIASNLFGNITASAYVTITGAKKPTLDKTLNDTKLSVVMGGNIVLPCGIALGNPPGNVTWWKSGERVSPEKGTVLSSGQLEILAISSEDAGDYTCVVSNPLGNSSRTFKLNVFEEPHLSRNRNNQVDEAEHVSVRIGNTTTLLCPISGNPRPIISWFKAGVPVNISSTTYQDKDGNLVLNGVDETKSGSYTCIGSNELGSTSLRVNLQVQVPPKPVDITNIDLKQEIVEGYTAVLNCRMYGVPTPRVSWFKDGAPLTVHVQDPTSQVLRFIATLDDNGKYKCIVTNDAGTASKEFELNILVPPRIADAGDEPVTVRAGEAITLSCGVIGVPPPIVLWRRNGIYLTHNSTEFSVFGSSIVLHNVTEESAGAYTCDAENSAGIAQQTFYLHVFFAPKIILEDENNDTIKVREGEELMLPCSAEGSPSPEISWLKDGELLHQYLAGVVILNDYSLVFVQTRVDQSGIYTCFANNTVGSAERHFNVEVTAPPGLLLDADPSTVIEVNEGDALTLTCPAASTSHYLIHWNKDGRSLAGSLRDRGDESPMKLSPDGRQLFLAEAHPTDGGNYSCVAVNPAGRVDAAFLVSVLMTPHFEEFNHVAHRTVLVGGSVNLNCSVSGNPQPQVSWKKDINPILGGRPPGVLLSRDQYYLSIPSARTYHTGTYTCIVTNKIMTKEREFYVTVLEPPVILGGVHEDVELMQSEMLALECPAGGEPKPQVTWYIEDCDGEKRALNVTDSLFVIEKISPEQSAVYHCEAESIAGTASKSYNVTVLAPPQFEGRESIEEISASEGDDVSLKCIVKGHPRPQVTWLHNGVEVNSARRRRRDTKLDVVEVLTLRKVKRGARGYYTAIASNRAGFSEKTYRLQVTVAPKAIKNNTEITTLSRRSVEFACPVEAVPLANVTWFFNDQPIQENLSVFALGYTITINNVSLSDKGNYSCLARNEAGNASANIFLQVLEPPSFHGGNFEEINAKSGENVILNCSAEGFPKPAVAWLRGYEILAEKSPLMMVSHMETNFEQDYVCIASNQAGAAEKSFVVRIISPPEVIANDTTINVTLHRPLRLDCRIRGSQLERKWFKDNVELNSDLFDFEFLEEKAVLLILQVNGNHTGVYRCAAENPAGSANVTFNVFVFVTAFWTDWTSWSNCSVACGEGTQTRNRYCSFGLDTLPSGVQVDKTACQGLEFERQPCSTACSIDGGWSDWSQWTECSASCGRGVQRRHRDCNSPKPSDGGMPCAGESFEARDCFLHDCHGIWSPWSEWSECTKTCDSGEKHRKRFCLGAPGDCLGPDFESEFCNVHPCSVGAAGAKWLPWQPWTSCSASCGKGFRRRVRQCRKPFFGRKPCTNKVKVEDCFLQPCSANLEIKGHLNGEPITSRFYANLSHQRDDDFERNLWFYNMDSKRPEEPNQALSKKWYPYSPLLLSPVAWNAASERESATNGFSLTKGRFLTQSKVHFSKGEDLSIATEGKGVDSNGQLTVVIEVAGEAPVVEPSASVQIKSLNQDFIQVADDKLMSLCEDVIMVNDQPVPFAMNSSVLYDGSRGTMPYLVERLSMVPTMTEAENFSFGTSASVSKRFEGNVCPPGFSHDKQHMLCQDIDECLRNPCSQGQVCTNTLGSYVCECLTGFDSKQNGCFDRNECNEEPSLCQHSCINTEGSYQCLCSLGFVLAEDGKSCIGDDEDESASMSNNEDSHRLARFDQLSFSPLASPQSCPNGYEMNSAVCEDVDECVTTANICGDNGLCANTMGSHLCIDTFCPIGYQRLLKNACQADCSKVKCQRGSRVAETLVFNFVSLNSNDFNPLEDILLLAVEEFAEVTQHRAKLLEGHALRLRTEGKFASLYAPAALKSHTLYRVVALVESLAENSDLIYATEFVVYLMFH